MEPVISVEGLTEKVSNRPMERVRLSAKEERVKVSLSSAETAWEISLRLKLRFGGTPGGGGGGGGAEADAGDGETEEEEEDGAAALCSTPSESSGVLAEGIFVEKGAGWEEC